MARVRLSRFQYKSCISRKFDENIQRVYHHVNFPVTTGRLSCVVAKACVIQMVHVPDTGHTAAHPFLCETKSILVFVVGSCHDAKLRVAMKKLALVMQQ